MLRRLVPQMRDAYRTSPHRHPMLLRLSLPLVPPALTRATPRQVLGTHKTPEIRRLVVLGTSETALAVARDGHVHGLDVRVFDVQSGVAMFSRQVTAQLSSRAAVTDDEALLQEFAAFPGLDETALIATSDAWLRRLQPLRDRLDTLFADVYLPSGQALDTCLDKGRFSRWCAAQGHATPLSWSAGLAARPAELRAPFMIRPAETRHGVAGSALPKAVQAETEQELKTWLERYAQVGCDAIVSASLLKRRLQQLSVGFARNQGRFTGFVAEKVRPLPDVCRSGSFVRLHDDPAVLAFAQRLVEQLDYRGIGEIELLRDRDSGELFVIELNARPWLQFALAHASGHDLLRVLTGRAASRYPTLRKSGVQWVAPLADLRYLYRMHRARRWGVARTLLRFSSTLLGANAFGRFAWDDVRPAFIAAD